MEGDMAAHMVQCVEIQPKFFDNQLFTPMIHVKVKAVQQPCAR